MSKYNAVLFVGLFIAMLTGCSAEYLPRPLYLTNGAFFMARLPCMPMASHPPTTDNTAFGRLRAQSYACSVPAGSAIYVVTIGAFNRPLHEPESASEKQATNDAIASKFASDVCREILSKAKTKMVCAPLKPLHQEGASVVDILLAPASHLPLARVRVSSPYLVVSMVTEELDWDERKQALDVKLPAP